MSASLYEYQPSFILGFHGCSQAAYDAVMVRGEPLHWSKKPFDWLGHGIYFWEGSVARAREWAEDRAHSGIIKDMPCVLGAVIDLRRCLDLFDLKSRSEVSQAHAQLKRSMRAAGVPMPKNVGATPDKGGRRLDCAVLNMLHQSREEDGLDSYDSVRGPFLEGRRIYPGAGFRTHTHIQICVRNPDCIKGYFRPLV